MSHTGEMLVQNNLGTPFKTLHAGTVSFRTCYEPATSLPEETTAPFLHIQCDFPR